MDTGLRPRFHGSVRGQSPLPRVANDRPVHRTDVGQRQRLGQTRDYDRVTVQTFEIGLCDAESTEIARYAKPTHEVSHECRYVADGAILILRRDIEQARNLKHLGPTNLAQ